MRAITLALACLAAAVSCSGAPKRAAEPERPVRRAVVAEVDGGRTVTLVADGVWAPLPREPAEPIILQHLDVRSAAIGLFFEEAELGSSVEDALNRWAMMLLSGPMLFRVTGVTNPVYPSDTEGSFTMEGEDKGVKMRAKCLIVHLGDPTADYWVLIFSVSPDAIHAQAFAQVDAIAKNLKIVPPRPPE